MDSRRSDFVRVAASFGLGAPLLFVFLVVGMGFLHPSYSHFTNFISDLGALDRVQQLL